MKIHELMQKTKPVKRKRFGRGNGSGHGTYSGRGLKGQKSRSGFRLRLGFEGGQNPLIRRIAKKRGFRNSEQISYVLISIDDLQKNFQAGDVIDRKRLYEKKIITRVETSRPLKILGSGTLSKKLTVHAHAATKSAKDAIEKNRGKLIFLSLK